MTHNQGGGLAIKDWHGGQVVILWGATALFGFIELIVFLVVADEDGPAWILVLTLAAFVLTPAILGVVTWKWFGSKRQRH